MLTCSRRKLTHIIQKETQYKGTYMARSLIQLLHGCFEAVQYLRHRCQTQFKLEKFLEILSGVLLSPNKSCLLLK